MAVSNCSNQAAAAPCACDAETIADLQTPTFSSIAAAAAFELTDMQLRLGVLERAVADIVIRIGGAEGLQELQEFDLLAQRVAAVHAFLDHLSRVEGPIGPAELECALAQIKLADVKQRLAFHMAGRNAPSFLSEEADDDCEYL